MATLSNGCNKRRKDGQALCRIHFRVEEPCWLELASVLSYLVAPGTFLLSSYGNFAAHYQLLKASPALEVDREVDLRLRRRERRRSHFVMISKPAYS